MVNYLEEYKRLIQQGASVYDELIQLYASDKRVENDWADMTVAETRTQRNGMLERLTGPVKLSSVYTGTLVSSIRHYLDGHWADYQEDFPIANVQKRKRVEQLHAELEAIAKGVGPIHNALRQKL